MIDQNRFAEKCSLREAEDIRTTSERGFKIAGTIPAPPVEPRIGTGVQSSQSSNPRVERLARNRNGHLQMTQFAAGLSTSPKTLTALSEVCHEVNKQLGGTPPDLVMVFFSHDHLSAADSIASEIRKLTGAKSIIGCTGESIVGNGLEIEMQPALSVWAAVLPGVELETYSVQWESTPDGPVSTGMPEARIGGDATLRAIFFLGDGFTCAIDSLLQYISEEFPGVPLLGGMASGARQPGTNALLVNQQVFREGGVGVLIRGGNRIDYVISQGCRPIGETYVVTKADDNVIYEISGKPALPTFGELYAGLSGDDQALARQGLHVGIAIDEYKSEFQPGDFLIANVMGVDQQIGAMAITSPIKPGQTIQFHLRDAQTADEELIHLLQKRIERNSYASALLFSCNGRGTRLFPVKNHDAKTIRTIAGEIPLAGFFAQGELGPVGAKNFIHGYTASVVLFAGSKSPPTDSPS